MSSRAAVTLSWPMAGHWPAIGQANFTFQHPNNPLRQVDLVIAPFSFEEIDADAEVLHAGGLSWRVASAATLVRMKSGTGRDQDASDIDALIRIAELEDE